MLKKLIGATLVALVSTTANLFAQCTCNCDYTIQPGQNSYYYAEGSTLKNNLISALGGAIAGKTICIQNGTYDKPFIFEEFHGTPNNPVTIKNCGGQVIIDRGIDDYALKLFAPRYMKILGDGCEDYEYGIRAIADANIIEIDGKFTDLEIAHLNVGASYGLDEHDGAAGIKVKDEPNCTGVDTLERGNPNRWVSRNIFIHDNYVHNVWTEGFYIGKGDESYQGKVHKGCSTVSYSNSLRNVKIYNNRVDSVGYDGIQVKDADSAMLVYNNIVTNYGLQNNGAHQEGIYIGTSKGDVYNNRVINGTGIGFKIKGHLKTNFYNNLIVGTGENGIYVNAKNDKDFIYLDYNYLRIFNNTIINVSKNEIKTAVDINWTDNGRLPIFVYENNILANANGNNLFNNTFYATNPSKSNNIETQLTDTLNFIQTTSPLLSGYYELSEGAFAIDNGKNVSAYAPYANVDLNGIARPQGESYDIGAFEYKDSNTSFEAYINSGFKAFINDSTTWGKDREAEPHLYYNTDHLSYTTGGFSSFGKQNNTAAPKEILGSYRHTKSGFGDTIRYNIPVIANGHYKVELYFATKNTDTLSLGQRKFKIYGEGQYFNQIDLYESGVNDKAISYAFTSYVNDGMLSITLAALSGSEAQVNGIYVSNISNIQNLHKLSEGLINPPSKAYPNPVKNSINMAIEESGYYTFCIYDMQGRILMEKNVQAIKGEIKQLDLSHIRKHGTLLIKITNEKGQISTQKIIKQ